MIVVMNYLRGQSSSPLKRTVRQVDEASYSELLRFADGNRMHGLARLLRARRRKSRDEPLEGVHGRLSQEQAWMPGRAAQAAGRLAALS